MRYKDILTEFGGRIVKGVNTTPDVGVNQIPIEAGKLGFKVDKDGRPPTLSKKVKGSKTNVLFNLGIAESVEEVRNQASNVHNMISENTLTISKLTNQSNQLEKLLDGIRA